MANHWMPIQIGDYHRETRHLTPAQHGAYLLLQMEYWTRGGTLPDDDAQLARITGLGANWSRSRPVLQALFAAGWKHPRLDAEMARASEISQRYSERGRKGAAARHARHTAPGEGDQADSTETEKTQSSQEGELALSNAQAMLKQCLNIPISESETDKNPSPSVRAALAPHTRSEVDRKKLETIINILGNSGGVDGLTVGGLIKIGRGALDANDIQKFVWSGHLDRRGQKISLPEREEAPAA
jgi:uncharacterized protein YdaU (DUF1376 family)